ncbi:UBP32-like protein [Mya arenaria]|uniref:UBP32-like protein n=1 Tax=Mya arenaria TaxID=6604 RepID=A0ABY7DYZ3_MYAAR|nr:UBP32-like protein [Mya arenaria]
MGGKDSKLSYISQEDALRRVTDAELKRLKDAFKRVSTIGGFMTETVFMREMLFKAFGGSPKGLTFKELLAGMVVLTKGSKEEKIKLTYNCQQNAACRRQLVSKARGKRHPKISGKWQLGGRAAAARIKLPPPCDLAGDSPFTTAAGRRLSDLVATALRPPDNLTVAGRFRIAVLPPTDIDCRLPASALPPADILKSGGGMSVAERWQAGCWRVALLAGNV